MAARFAFSTIRTAAPLHPSPCPTSIHKGQSRSRGRVMSFTAFVVDDDPAVLKALSRIIRMAGHQCLAFQSSREFLDSHDPSVPGCAVIDLTMPGLDGLELQQRLLESDEVRPIIFLSGHGDIASSVHAMKAGAID